MQRLLKLKRGIPVLSAFTFYLIATVAAAGVAVVAGAAARARCSPRLLGTLGAPGPSNAAVAPQIVFALSVRLRRRSSPPR